MAVLEPSSRAHRVALHILMAVATALALSACGGGRGGAAETPTASATVPMSAGQMAPPSAAARVTHYAASRFAEQASFGPTPALIAELRAKGFEAWIDEQFALPLRGLDPAVAESSYALTTLQEIPTSIWLDLDNQFMRAALSAPDQLRWRVMWSISNYIVVSRGKGDTPPGNLHWINLLYRQGLGNYRDLLREVSLNPFMAHYLDNDQNRPKSAECPQCAPNENYARELMQLFSIGVINLNPDGTPVLDGRGRPVESYTQTDVEELARVLTGWVYNPAGRPRPQRNWGNWDKPMTPSTWPPERDSGRKVVMGQTFPAGQGAAVDLDAAISMLMAHPNIAPFVSLRLIQHLVKSDPSPAYVRRVAQVFRDNGRGVAGDLKAVVKAVLLDPEARRGDDPTKSQKGDGKFREPFLHRAAAFRGLGCREFSYEANGTSYWTVWAQRLIQADSVFGYYAPTDRAPGSNLLAPEQGMVTANELTDRLNFLNGLRFDRTANKNTLAAFERAGCEAASFVRAFETSPASFLDLVSLRYFRGAMPPTLRTTMEELIRKPQWNTADPSEGTMRMLSYALSSPSFGVSR